MGRSLHIQWLLGDAMAAVNKRSTVWQFFDQTASGNQVECSLCKAKLAYNNSTGSMRNHLRWKHPNTLEGETSAAGTGATASGVQASIRDYTYSKARSEHISRLKRSPPKFVKMSKGQTLRALVSERLAAAAEDIFVLFERTIAEYEDELCRSKEENQRKHQLQDKVLSPRIELVRGNVQIPMSPGPSLDQESTETPQIKEEPEEQIVKQEEEQLPVPVPESSAVCVKTEDSSLLQQRQTEPKEVTQGEDLSSEPHFHSETEGQTEHSSETDNDDNWTRPFSCTAAQMETEADGDCNKLSPKNTSAPETTAHNEQTSGADRGAERKKHQCIFCQKKLGSKQSLKIHIRRHTGEKPHNCTFCEKSFAQKSALNLHMRTHTGEKPYKCSICGKTFSQKYDVNKHERTHTGEKPYSCLFCKKTFAQKGHMDIHVRTHTGEKPYSCSMCPKTFTQKGDLYKHERTHTGEKPFSCLVCGKTFGQQSYLRRHMSTHSV